MSASIITKPEVNLKVFIELSSEERKKYFQGLDKKDRKLIASSLSERKSMFLEEARKIRDCVDSARELRALLIRNNKEDETLVYDPRNSLYNMEADVYLRRKELEEKVSGLNSIFEELRRVCDHEWESDGWDSHYKYYRCSICGEESSE